MAALVVFFGGPLAGQQHMMGRLRRYRDKDGLKRSEVWTRTEGRSQGFYELRPGGLYRWVPGN